MKSIAFIFFSLMLMACSRNEKTNEVQLAMAIDTMADKAGIESHRSKDENNKGEITFSTIGQLDIMDKDLGIMNVVQAEEEALKMGERWRLPNEAELNVIYEQVAQIKNLSCNYYVGMEEGAEVAEDGSKLKVYLRKSVVSGELISLQTNEEIYSIYGARLVRDHH